MSENASDLHRQQKFYWDQMFQLKMAAAYIRLYRDSLGRWVTSLGALKAIASCGSIAAWVIWKEYAFVWGAIIAASQLADALKDVFPFAKKHKAACEHALTLANLFIDVQLEWESVYSGQYSNEEIMKRLHQLRMLQLDTESRSFPDGLAKRDLLLDRATQEAAKYLATTYGVD
ncbi:MAG: hypothetical protein WB424_17910 [Terracidiphilus sp.]|jgi:hypothetical protein